MKKLFSVMLALALLMPLLPMAAVAASAEDGAASMGCSDVPAGAWYA